MSNCTACGNECYEDRIVLDGFDYCCEGCAREHKKVIQKEIQYLTEAIDEAKKDIEYYRKLLERLLK
jgi:hypothetical protein